jgi:transcriptional regulator with XRE-family HTH domain
LTAESECPIYWVVSLGKNLRVLLDQHGMEQKDLAKKLGVAPSSVSEWVTGETFPRHRRLAAIARALKTTVQELVA